MDHPVDLFNKARRIFLPEYLLIGYFKRKKFDALEKIWYNKMLWNNLIPGGIFI